jgi:hypothetical protein
MKFRVFWDVAPCSHVEVDRRFRGAYCLHRQGYSSETSVNYSVTTWHYILEDSELHVEEYTYRHETKGNLIQFNSVEFIYK